MCSKELGVKNNGGTACVARCEEEMSTACSGAQKTSGGCKAMRAPSLMVLDAENSSGKEEAARRAAVKIV